MIKLLLRPVKKDFFILYYPKSFGLCTLGRGKPLCYGPIFFSITLAYYREWVICRTLNCRLDILPIFLIFGFNQFAFAKKVRLSNSFSEFLNSVNVQFNTQSTHSCQNVSFENIPLTIFYSCKWTWKKDGRCWQV